METVVRRGKCVMIEDLDEDEHIINLMDYIPIDLIGNYNYLKRSSFKWTMK